MEIISDKSPSSGRQGRARGGSSPGRTCTYCKKREPSNARPEQKLKRCSRCRSSVYCSRVCQRADWKRGHQRTCISGAIMAKNSCYLDGLPSEEMVMDQLVDAYRLRIEDERMYRGRLRGWYSVDTTRTIPTSPATTTTEAERSATSSSNTSQALQYALQDFRDFLDLAEAESRNAKSSNEENRSYENAEEEEEDSNRDSSSPSSSTSTDSSSFSSRPSSLTLPIAIMTTTAMESEQTKQGKDTTILPQWWNAEKRALCEARALNKSGGIWSNLHHPAGKDDIIRRYQDNLMPMKLRMLAERVYSSDVMGQFSL